MILIHFFLIEETRPCCTNDIVVSKSLERIRIRPGKKNHCMAAKNQSITTVHIICELHSQIDEQSLLLVDIDIDIRCLQVKRELLE